jgi:predicted Fe-Mo cluster-binding NifX family protein
MRVLLDASLVKWITGRNAGRFRFVEAGVALRLTELGKAEVAVQQIEHSVRAAMPQIERVLLHVEARTSTQLCYAVPLADLSGTMSDHFGEAPYFAFVTVDRVTGAVAEQRVRPNPHQSLEKRKGIQVAKWLAAQKVDIVLARVDLTGRGPGYVLRDAGIEAQHTEKRTVADVFGSHAD